MKKKYDICGIGNALVDEQYQVTHDDIERLGLELNQMTLSTPEEQHKQLSYLNNKSLKPLSACGGSATNTLVAASHFNATCVQFCRVGNDDAGNAYLDSLKDCGVDHIKQHFDQTTLPTGRCIVLNTPDAKRTMSTCLGISAEMTPQFIDETLLSQSTYLYMEGYMVTNDINLSTTLQSNDMAIHHGIKRVLTLSDPGVVQFFKDAFLQFFKTPLDLLFCNEEEAFSITDTQSISDAIKVLKEISTSFAITRGEKGAVLFDSNEVITIPGIQVHAIDTNGAGDIFAGAMLSQLIQEESFEEAGLFANRAASLLVQHIGPRLSADQYSKLFKYAKLSS